MHLRRNLLTLLVGVWLASNLWAEEKASSPTPEQLRQWYEKPQAQWPEPVLDDDVPYKALGALDKEPPFQIKGQKLELRLELGKLLFFDPILSGSKQHACASCHDANLGWADGRRFSFGHDRQRGNLNAPTVLNAGHLPELLWDGRAGSIEAQARLAIVDPAEMAGNPSDVIRRLAEISGYRERFKAAFGRDDVRFDDVTASIATYLRSLNTPNTEFDRFMRGDREALNDLQLRGLHVFRTNGRCMNCHNGKLLSDGQYHHLGTSFYGVGNFKGRYAVTSNVSEFSAFRTAPLRNVAATGPYMHNGLIRNLEDVLALYNGGWWQNHPTEEAKDDPRFAKLSSRIKPLDLEKEELRALKAFLLSLGSGGSTIAPPELPR